MSGKTILILGGGIGGIAAASRLRKALPREHRVVLVERETRCLFAPSLLWLMGGLRKPEQISRPLPALAGRGVEIVRGTVEGIDPGNRSARVNGREIKADYLIVALGAEFAPETVPGLAQADHDFYTLAGAESLRDARLALRRGRIVVLVSSVPFKCPAAPYEAAMLLEYDCRKRKLRDSVQLDAVVCPDRLNDAVHEGESCVVAVLEAFAAGIERRIRCVGFTRADEGVESKRRTSVVTERRHEPRPDVRRLDGCVPTHGHVAGALIDRVRGQELAQRVIVVNLDRLGPANTV